MKSVLLIDDDPMVLSLLSQYLRRGGWQVWEARDGEGGLNLAREHRPAVVLCDLMLPRVNGFQVCRALRQEPLTQGVRIVAMSSKAYPQDRKNALDAGADEFLLKPVSPQALCKMLDRMVDAPKSTAPKSSSEEQVASCSLRFWGVRGSIATPGPKTVFYGGNTPCIEVRAGDQIIILDAGTGIRGLGAALTSEFRDSPLDVTILLTHTHWDHIQGFPFFAPLYNSNNHVRVLGYEGARLGLTNVLSNQMESPHFPINLKDLPGTLSIEELKEMEFALGEVKVRAAFANHPGICVGYRLETGFGAITYFPDNESHFGSGASELDPTDMRQKMIDFVWQTEVLIIDAQYDCQEYQSHEGWGHGCVHDAVELAVRAQVRRLYLFHHDPDHDDQAIARMVEAAREFAARKGGRLAIEAAREGDMVRLA